MSASAGRVRAHEGYFSRLPWAAFRGRVPRVSDVTALVASLRPFRTEHRLVRLGARHDGGYLVPDDLEGLTACFSPGVGTIAAFEADIESRGIPAFLLDPTVPPPGGFERRFEARFLGTVTSDTSTTLEDWVARAVGPEPGAPLLQMDIEGDEWDVLESASRELLRRFRIVVVELHDLDRMRDPEWLSRHLGIIQRLMRDFVVVHLHANNCCVPVTVRGIAIPPVLEVTLHRRDRVMHADPLVDAHHPMDRPNLTDLPDRPLGPAWGTRGGVRHHGGEGSLRSGPEYFA